MSIATMKYLQVDMLLTWTLSETLLCEPIQLNALAFTKVSFPQIVRCRSSVDFTEKNPKFNTLFS